MPAPRSRPDGAPIRLELTAADPETAAAFSAAVLGIAVSPPDPRFGARSLDHPNGLAGLLDAAAPQEETGWLIHLLARAFDDSVRDAVAAGAEVLVPVSAAADLGRWADLRDPSGARFELWEPGTMPGLAVEGEPGAPGWFELHATSAYREAVRFSERGLGWSTSVLGDADEFRMVVNGPEDTATAGVYDASVTEPGTPSRWWPSFVVADADADAVARTIAERGGAVLDGPTDTPFGRLGHALDPEGAAFAFLGPPTRG